MSVAMQIRDVPEELRDVIAQAAAAQGRSVQAYLLDVLRREARSLANVEMFGRTSSLRVQLDLPADVVVREGRDGGFGVDRRSLP